MASSIVVHGLAEPLRATSTDDAHHEADNHQRADDDADDRATEAAVQCHAIRLRLFGAARLFRAAGSIRRYQQKSALIEPLAQHVVVILASH